MRTDPDNVWLWRYTPRRLDGEVVRDAVLAVSGKLETKMFGPPVSTKAMPSGEIVALDETQAGRRSIYLMARRSALPSFLQVFDVPAMETNCTRRVTSTSPLQSLAFMNSEFVKSQAGHFADRILKEAPPESAADSRTAGRAIELALAWQPRTGELDSIMGFLKKQAWRYPALTGEALRRRVYTDLCQVLLSANEFIYVD